MTVGSRLANLDKRIGRNERRLLPWIAFAGTVLAFKSSFDVDAEKPQLFVVVLDFISVAIGVLGAASVSDAVVPVLAGIKRIRYGSSSHVAYRVFCMCLMLALGAEIGWILAR